MSYRISLSGVSSEFESARNAVADGLQSKGLEVRIQRSFRQGDSPGTLLRKLHDYIRDCDAVICLIGAPSGDYPPPAAEFLPEEMAVRQRVTVENREFESNAMYIVRAG